MFCGKCGSKIEAADKFCPFCGAPAEKPKTIEEVNREAAAPALNTRKKSSSRLYKDKSENLKKAEEPSPKKRAFTAEKKEINAVLAVAVISLAFIIASFAFIVAGQFPAVGSAKLPPPPNGIQNTPGNNQSAHNPIVTKESSDMYTWYIRDYVGRNLANCGGESYHGGSYYLMDEYGEAEVKLIIITDDGSYVDPEDKESLKQYVVTGQSIAPNTELKLTFWKNSDGEEDYEWLTSQSINEIELYVKLK